MNKDLQEAQKEALARRAKQASKGKEEKKKNIYYTANFEGLVDIVLNDDYIKFLTSDSELLDTVEVDGTEYLPPPKRGLPPNLQIPCYDNVLGYAQNHDISGESGVTGTCKGCTLLYNDLIEYHKNISELPNNDLYQLLTLWDLHTYMIEKVNFSPIIYFYSIAERGKSRTLKGMINVAYRGLRKGDIRDAQLLRDCTHLKSALAFDMMDFWDKVTGAGSVDVVLNRYERGMTVSRVNRPEKGAFQDTDYYDVFGPTIIATNEIIHDIADTRSIPIVMIKSSRDFENEVKPEDSLDLKERLTAFRLAHFNDDLPKINKLVRSRLGDIFRPLHQMLLKVKPDKEEEFKKMVLRVEKMKLIEKTGSIDADVLQAWIAAKVNMVSGVIASQEVADAFNVDKGDKERLASRRIGNRLKSSGFQTTQTSNHTLGFFWNEETTEKLKKEYGVLSGSPELTETPETPKDDEEYPSLDIKTL